MIKLGVWHHSKNFDDVASVDDNGDPIRHDDNYGGYGIIDQLIWREKEDQGLSVFFTGGGAPQDRNLVDFHAAGGLTYLGLIPKRDKDQAGIGVTYSSISGKMRKAQDLEGGETTVEGTYRIVINDNIALQPDFQYVINPGADRTLKNATVCSLRLEIIY